MSHANRSKHSKSVITWQSPCGETLDVCVRCERDLSRHWPRDSRGEEFCQVSRGKHVGRCGVTQSHD